MQLLAIDRSSTAQTAGVTLLTVAALAVLALTGTHWTWQWLAPRPLLRATPAVNGIDHSASASGLFGNPALDTDNATPTGIDIRLLGVIAATTGGRGYAVLRIEPKQILTVPEGEDIAPGIRLAEVAADHVILERGGSRETLGWPAKSLAAESPALRIGK